MDLVAYRICRLQVRVRQNEQLTRNVWDQLAREGAVNGITNELSDTGAYHGISWMVNPHELTRFGAHYDPETDTAIQSFKAPIWVYAIMPRGFALARRMQGSRKGGCRIYPADKFAGRQRFINDRL